MAERDCGRQGWAQEPVVFEVGVSRKKPENIRHKENPCPFCDVPGLTDIFRREGDRIWLMNKYRTLQRTVQTVVIESADHTGDISTYGREENRGVFRFAVGCFYQMLADPRFASVVMFKNYGPLSGGSLLHPHLQIVGFEQANAYAHVGPENFGGGEVYTGPDVAVTLSDHPVMGFVEINVGIDAAGLADAAAPVGEKSFAAAPDAPAARHTRRAGRWRCRQAGQRRTANLFAARRRHRCSKVTDAQRHLRHFVARRCPCRLGRDYRPIARCRSHLCSHGNRRRCDTPAREPYGGKPHTGAGAQCT